MSKISIVDDFRFIGSLHTTARILPVCSLIIKIVNTTQLPLEIIKRRVIDWSIKIEGRDTSYSKRKGKLTVLDKKSNKLTSSSAFEHYIDLLISLGLLHKSGNIVTVTRIGTILNSLCNQSLETVELSPKEKLFYSNILFTLDGDALLMLMEMLNESDNGESQKSILINFKNSFSLRINAKQISANTQTLSKIREWYLKINQSWTKPEIYAEHLLVPRLEWLQELDIIFISKNGSKTMYVLNTKGKIFYESFPYLLDTKVRDLNVNWCERNFSNASANLLMSLNSKELIKFPILSESEKKSLIGELLIDAFKVIDTSGAQRISLYPAFLYITVNIAVDNDVILELADFIDFFKVPIFFNNKKYYINQSSRITESYITQSI